MTPIEREAAVRYAASLHLDYRRARRLPEWLRRVSWTAAGVAAFAAIGWLLTRAI